MAAEQQLEIELSGTSKVLLDYLLGKNVKVMEGTHIGRAGEIIGITFFQGGDVHYKVKLDYSINSTVDFAGLDRLHLR